MADPPELSQVPPCPGGTLYTIRPGDSFFSLARRFNTTVDALTAANPGVDPTNLQIGQTICIPVPSVPGPCPGGFVYSIRAGDTFFSLARRFGTTVEALIAVNPGVDPDRLQVGQVICLPPGVTGPIPCPGGTIYRVRAGDTLFGIGRRFGVSVPELIAANPHLPDPERLQIGDFICIPRRIQP